VYRRGEKKAPATEKGEKWKKKNPKACCKAQRTGVENILKTN
jgi:hypothetical protein